MKDQTLPEILKVLKRRVAEYGSAAAFADYNAISRQYVGDVLSGRREPGRKILDALGYERIVTYREKQ